jgi:uncharacterized delta-60 repeat protein
MNGFTDIIKKTLAMGLIIFGIVSCGLFEDSEGGNTLPGSKDTSFGQAGTVLGAFAAPAANSPVITASIALRSDGHIVIGGSGGTEGAFGFFYHRLSDRGAVLSSSATDPDSTIRINALALDVFDNLILAGSEGNTGAKDFYRTRLFSDGSIDTAFTGAGIDDLSGSDDEAFAVAVRSSDGKIILGGYRTVGVKQFTLAGYNTNGIRDTSFGTGGISALSIGTNAAVRSVLTGSDGSIYALGESNAGGTKDFVFAKYYSSGLPNSSIGAGQGYVLLDYHDLNAFQLDTNENTTDDVLHGAVMQGDYYIIAAGSTVPAAGGVKTPMLAKFYTWSGSVDSSFGIAGRSKTVFGIYDAEALAVAVQGDGKIVIAGYIANGSGNTDFLVARYLSTGILDPEFGLGGYVTTNFGAGIDARATSVAVQSDGKIIAGGILSDGRYAVVRYNP